MNEFRQGDRVLILPSKYGNDLYSGPAKVLSAFGDHVKVEFELKNLEVVFHVSRVHLASMGKP